MKVVYDMSMLGVGYRNHLNRTGTFRVVENIAYGLVNSQKCDLSFYSSLGFWNFGACLDYLKSNPILGKFPFPQTKLNLPLDQSIQAVCDAIHDSVGIKHLLLRMIRKSLFFSSDLVDILISSNTHKILNQADIYHSPAYAIPNQIRDVPKIKAFLTVYDLIPILYPKFFDHNIDFHKKIIHSLKPDDSVLCISKSTKDDLCNYLPDIDTSRVFVTHLAAAPDIFYPCPEPEKIISIRKKYNIPNAPCILSLCTLEPRKNIDHIIRCFALVVEEQKIDDLYLVLVGSKGWSYDKIFQEIANFSLAKERIIITGYVADEDLSALYSSMIAFAYLSFYEGFGLPPLEAMQCGIPVITSNTSSLPEVVGDAGIMLEPLDTDGLCQSMLDIYNSPSLRASMSSKSIQRAKLFSWEKCIEQTLRAYRTVL